MTHPPKVTPAKVLRAAGRATSRRQQYSSSTRRALIESAMRLFTERGYAATSLDQVVSQARLTKGALYHHYKGKQALFEAAFEQLEKQTVEKISAAIGKQKDPWVRAQTGLRTFLELCQEPTYRRIVMQEAPVVLGFERWKESEDRSTYGLVRDIVGRLLDDYDVEDTMTETFTQVFYGAMRSAAFAVAESDDPERASREVEAVIIAVLAGLRSLADSGINLLDPAVATPRTLSADGAGTGKV